MSTENLEQGSEEMTKKANFFIHPFLYESASNSLALLRLTFVFCCPSPKGRDRSLCKPKESFSGFWNDEQGADSP
jgi:hypothetical protein